VPWGGAWPTPPAPAPPSGGGGGPTLGARGRL